MRICYIITLYFRSILCYCFLCDSVYDFFSSLELSKVFKTPLPLIGSCYFLRFYLFSVCKKVDRYLLRSLSVLVICIIPCLASFYLCSLGCIAVCYCCSFDLLCVSGYIFFVYRIYDILSSLLYIKICEGCIPVVFFIKYNCLSCLFSICKKLNRYTCRTLAILIVGIIPHLCYIYLCLSRCVLICYIITLYFRSILCYCIFCDSVYDFFSVLELSKVFKAPLPLIGSCYFLRVYLFSVCKKVDRYAFRSLSVLVICIIPCLASFHIYSLRYMLICYCKSIIAFSIPFRYFSLLNGVCYIVTVSVFLFKLAKHSLPVVICIEYGSLALYCSSTCIELYCDAFRSNAILVICIIPNLLSLYACFCGNFLICKYETVSCISGYLSLCEAFSCKVWLYNGIFNLTVCIVLRKIFPCHTLFRCVCAVKYLLRIFYGCFLSICL